jgi:hypothetical protein
VNYIDAGTTISPDGRYRYLLWREWRGTHDPENWRWLGAVDGAGHPLGEPKSCLFIMLNPSTADGSQDDPTIRRCVAFASAWRFERLEVVNLFAFRAASPHDLLALGDVDDPVGPDNLSHVFGAAARAGRIVCAWGSHGGHLNQSETVLGWLDDANSRSRFALGVTATGQPRHPLYVKADTPLTRL